MYMLNGGAPFRKDHTGAVYDCAGERVRLMGHTLDIFTELAADSQWSDTAVAYVSRTEYPEWALPCLQCFNVTRGVNYNENAAELTLFDMGKYKEIYPGSKITHFKRIHKASGIPFEDMLFFDNEKWNCVEVARLGVVCVYTPNGLTSSAWQEGVSRFEAAKGGKTAAAGAKPTGRSRAG